jgi:hypothetical protein
VTNLAECLQEYVGFVEKAAANILLHSKPASYGKLSLLTGSPVRQWLLYTRLPLEIGTFELSEPVNAMSHVESSVGD